MLTIMGYLNQYLGKSVQDLQNELLILVKKYNKMRNTFLVLYVTAFKRIPQASVIQDDYYIIHDMLDGLQPLPQLDMYLETPGGSGEAAEEIIRLLHKKADKVCFVVSGEAKSAGTIMALSGSEILMTETGSLGPIDAQINMGRMTFSAYDYLEWLTKKYDECQKGEPLNPVDATIIAQISPGELRQVQNSLDFAKDIVTHYLSKYKFSDWAVTEQRHIPVTDDMKKERAEEIAGKLLNHSRWRSHGRSLKIEDLNNLGLKIQLIDNDLYLRDIVYRIQTICRVIFETSNIYKLFVTSNNVICKAATRGNGITIPQMSTPTNAEIAQAHVQCPKCGKQYNFYAKFVKDSKAEKSLQQQGFIEIPKDCKYHCECGMEIDLLGLKNELERVTKKKIIYNSNANVT